MIGKSTDARTRAKVCLEKVANPEASLREIKRTTGINHETVRNILDRDLKELLTASDVMKSFFETNFEIMRVGSEKTKKAMETMDPSDIKEAEIFQKMADKAFLQNRLAGGDSTENHAHTFKDAREASDADLDSMVKQMVSQ